MQQTAPSGGDLFHSLCSSFSIPEVYSNAAIANISPYEFEITFGLGSSNYEGVRPVVNLRMSPQFAKEFSRILSENVKLDEENLLPNIVSVP